MTRGIRQPLTPERILAVHTHFTHTGSLTKTGLAFGYSRERIRQILLQGKRHKLIPYRPQHARNRHLRAQIRHHRADTVAAQHERLTTFRELAQQLAVPYHQLTHALSPSQQRRLRTLFRQRQLQHARQHVLRDYTALVKQLGYHPSTTVMDQTERMLAIRIRRYWGSIHRFRQLHHLPVPEHRNRQLAAERREQRRQQLYAQAHSAPIIGLSSLSTLDHTLVQELLDARLLIRYLVRGVILVAAPSLNPQPWIQQLHASHPSSRGKIKISRLTQPQAA